MKEILLGLIGIGAGLFTAAGAVTVVTVVGMIPRFAARTGTTKSVRLFENCVFGGIVVGNIVSMYFPVIQKKLEEQLEPNFLLDLVSVIVNTYLSIVRRIPAIGVSLLLFYGIVIGIYVGCIALSIAEMVDAIPIFTRRLRKKTAFLAGTLILGIAFGKIVGAYFFFFVI